MNSASSDLSWGGMPRALLSVGYRQWLFAGKGLRRDVIHHCPPHITDGNYTLALAIHGLGKEAKGLFDLGLLLRGDVVLFGELRLSRFGPFGGCCGCCGWAAFGRLW